MFTVRKAKLEDIEPLYAILRQNKKVFGFIPKAALMKSIEENEVIVAENKNRIMGFTAYHHRKDGVSVIYEIAVDPEVRVRGVGKRLVNEVESEALTNGHKILRLKCPLELPANGFYYRMGFQRISIEDGKIRPLAVWEKNIKKRNSEPIFKFFMSLTSEVGDIRKISRLWDKSGDSRNPFAHVVFTPLFSSKNTITEIQNLKKKIGSEVIFDSGGYQIQMGKMRYEQLFKSLLDFYHENTWADWYVLPDHVPSTKDTSKEIEYKVRETLDFARLFIQMMPDKIAKKALGVVHGRTEEQIISCVKNYVEMGLEYIGFGSFGTSGPNGSVNLVSKKSLKLLQLVQTLAHEYNMKIHIFGIGSPTNLLRLSNAGITPTSFDSSGWWKAGGFGKVFFPKGKQRHITTVDGFDTTINSLEKQKQESGHECIFCSDLKKLRSNRTYRVMHNLISMMDTVEMIVRE